MTDTVPEGAITVKIEDKTYYYTPNEGDNVTLLKTLASTGQSALKETDASEALYTINGKYYSYDTENLPASGYKLSSINITDPEALPSNVITLYEKTEVVKYYDPSTGEEVSPDQLQPDVDYKEVTTIETTPKYYEVALNKTEYGNPKGDKSVSVTIDKLGQTVTYKYTEPEYNQTEANHTKDISTTDPGGSSNSHSKLIGGSALNNPEGTTISIDGVLYKDNSVTGTITSINDFNYVDILGGAIYNAGEITSIAGGFINNSIEVDGDGSYRLNISVQGGAIYNNGTISDITGAFIENYVSVSFDSHVYSYGGAIYNSGVIGNIASDFINNHAFSSSNSACGGAIYNDYGTIHSISGDFSGNYVSASDYYADGGAVYNSGEISDITGDFISNYAFSPDYANGGAISNRGTIGNLIGNFIGNYTSASGSYASAYGGAIDNGGTIGDITGDFIGNYAFGSSLANGGAIYNANSGTINDITGDFIGNYAASTNNSYVYGGAIDNRGTIGDITGDFIGNYATGSSYANGGAIYNGGTIGDIMGDFIGNYVSSTNGRAQGGAILGGTISNTIHGNFIGNYATSSGSAASGGAIYNYEISNITGDFIKNYVSSNDYANGGAIYNTSNSTSGSINGNFIGNYAFGATANGGAIYHEGTIESIIGEFLANYAHGDNAEGGAIYNYRGTIDSIAGNFIENYVFGSSVVSGGAIYNVGDISSITGNFIGNYVSSSSSANGGAIYNNDTIEEITANFIGNYVEGVNNALGGAIYDAGTIYGYDVPLDKIIKVTGFTYTNSETGESRTFYTALRDSQKEQLQNGYKVVVSTDSQPVPSDQWEQMESLLDSFIESGMITTELPVTEDQIAQLTGGLVNSSFFGNYAKSAEGEAKGGAIYTTNSLTIAADNGNSVFSGNYVEDVNGKRPEAVYVDSSAATLTLQSKNDGTILFEDQINGASGYNLKLTGDETGRVILNNDVINAKIDLSEVTLQLGRDDVFNQSQALNLSSGRLSMVNNAVGTMNLPGFSINGTVNMAVDADLANKTMDKITADNYQVSDDAQLNVDHINLISDANEDKTDIQFADRAFSNKVSYTGENPIAYSKIYKYDVSYNPNDGFFTFLRGSSTNASENYNPVVLAPAVANQTGAYSTQMQVFNYAFQHSDNFMNLPYIDRLAYSRENQYALINDSTVGPYSPIFTRVNQGGYWVKPYVSFESIPLKNGPKVSNIAYGSLIGYDSKLTPIRNGFERVLTGYVGYNGANQSYSGVDTYQNGGLLGGTVTLYKGNFFNATTLSAGASVGESSNMYGHENYTMFMAGLGNKFGYNFEFQRGRYILQPSMLMSYTFVNTFDYTNAAGTRMSSDPLHAIQLSPGVKFIMNTKNGWQPYLGVNMVWNIFTGQKVMADDVRLPSMSIKPYVQYGLGIQKLIKDKFLAFGQAMVTNGGRNGVSLSFGLRWLIGRE